MSENYKYRAFLSYSHKDEIWAKWLHHALETYRVPRNLVGRKTRNGKIPNRLVPVFRDRDELAGDPDLSERIRRALSQSRYLVVVCSPNAARSKYVNDEIATFRSMGREKNMLCVVVPGEDEPGETTGSIEHYFPAALTEKQSGGDAQPIAADARKDKDGKTNAKLKLIAGILGVDFDELRRRERLRRRKQMLMRVAVGTFVTAILLVMYVAAADAGLRVAGGERIRNLLDEHEASFLRPLQSDPAIQSAAAKQRRILEATMTSAQSGNGLMFDSLKEKTNPTAWVTAQALTSLFHCTDCDEKEFRSSLRAVLGSDASSRQQSLRAVLSSSNGEPSPAMPAMWTAAAIAIALGKQGLLVAVERARALERFAEVQDFLKSYRADDTGGWNMFANQVDPAKHNVYPTALALLVLLETRAAGLDWDGSGERRDALLRATAQWLINAYDAEASPPGWHDSSASTDEVFDGLTLQVFAELLRAEDEAGIRMPDSILDQIPQRLADCANRDLTFPIGSAAYATPARDFAGREYVARQSIGFLWHSWAIDGAVRWLKRANRDGLSRVQRARVRRALGHLVVDLGYDAVSKARSTWIYLAAETLYGLATVPAPGTDLSR